MKVAVLAGGQGTRLAEETRVKSKAMVRIGEQPILWHLLKYYEHYGYTRFVIALGHHAELDPGVLSKPGFARGRPSTEGACTTVRPAAEPGWTVELVETGLETMSGGRIKRLGPYLEGEPFMLTWCDGLADIDLGALRAFHRAAWTARDAQRGPSAGALRPVDPRRRQGAAHFARRRSTETSGSTARFSSSSRR